jgi:nitrate/nitrite transporter NarK
MERLLDQEGQSNEKGWNQLPVGYEVYSYRWIILFTFILSGVANAFVLLTWAPITDKAQTYWDDIDITTINLLSVIFQICYVPGTFLSLYFSSNYSMYSSLIAGSLLTAIGCFIRYVGVLIRDNAGAHTSYAVVFIGTTLVALAQPVYLNMPAKIASIWFATNERDASSILGSLSNPLGSAIGSFIPGMLVSGTSLSSIKHGIQTTLMVQMIFAFVSLGASIFLFRERPPTPPSATAENTADARANSPSVFEYFGTLLTSPEYLKILIPFTIILANLNAVAALLNQLPTNYSSGQIGITGAALIMGGFIASLAIGYILDYTKAHLFLMRLLYVLTFISWTFFHDKFPQ